LGRLLLLGAVLAVMSPLAATRPAGLFIVLGIAFAVTIPFSLWLQRADNCLVGNADPFILDILVITGLIHFTGGIQSDLALLYPLVILAAGIVTSGSQAFRIALLAVLVYSILIILEIGQLLPMPEAVNLPQAPVVIQTLMMRILVFLLFAAAVSYVSDLVSEQYRQLGRFRNLGRALVENLPVPVIGYRRGTGEVMFANKAAADAFGATASDLRGRDVADLLKPLATSSESKQGGLHELQMDSGEKRPVVAVYSDGAGVWDQPEAGQIGLVLFQDVSGVESAPDRSGDEGIEAARSVLTEVVHAVGNPVTVLQNAAELISQAVETAATRGRIDIRDWRMIRSLCEVVSQESARLDRQVADYLEMAARRPEQIRDLAKKAEKWAKQIAGSGDS